MAMIECYSGRYFSEGDAKQLVISMLEGIPTHQNLKRRGAFYHLDHKKVSHEALRVFLQLSPQETLKKLEYGCKITTPKIVLIDPRPGFHKLKNAGAYHHYNKDWVNPQLFPVRRTKPHMVEMALASFNAEVSVEKACEIVETYGWQLGKFIHLLTYGLYRPSTMRHRTVIALGEGYQAPDNKKIWFHPYIKGDQYNRVYLNARNFFGIGRSNMPSDELKSVDRLLLYRSI